MLGKHVAYVTPTFLLAKVFFQEILKIIPEGLRKQNNSDFTIDLITGGRIKFFTGTRLDNFRGLKFHTIVVDEASYIPNLEHGWLNSLRPTLTDYKGRAIFLSTPKGTNYFYSLFLRGKEGSNEKDWQSYKYSTYDNPHIEDNEIDAAKESLPMNVFEQEYMANPMENASNPFGNDFIRKCIKPMSTLPAMYYGIDLAKYVDWTVIIGLDTNGDVCHYQRFQNDWKVTKDIILQIDKNKPVLIDSTGVGDAITEDLQRYFSSMYGFKYTSTTKQQIMELLSASIQKGDIGFPEGTIKEELDIFEYLYTPTGVRYSAPQGFHDDCVNALALAVKCKESYKHKGVYRFV